MKDIEIFSKKIPIILLIIVIIFSIIGTGIMASQFSKGPQTFYSTGITTIVQLPNSVLINETITINASSSIPTNQSFDDVFTIFHRNNRLVQIDVNLTNTDTLKKFFDDVVILIRRNDSNILLATLTLNKTNAIFTDNDALGETGIKYRANIFYTAKNNNSVNQVPVIITAQVTST